MKTEILATTKNPFLNREELTIKIESEGTPKLQDIIATTKKDEETVVVTRVTTLFGKNEFVANILIYDTKEDKERIQVIPKKIRKKMEEERKKAEEEARKKAEEEKKAAEEAAKKAAEEKAAEETKTEDKTEETGAAA